MTIGALTGDLLIGVDSGTSMVKAVAFTTSGEEIGSASLPNTYDTLANGGAEQDMARTWNDLARVLVLLGEQVPGLARRAGCLAVTAQGDGTFLIDAAGEPVGPGWLWLDVRAAALAERLLAGPEYPAHYRTTGTALNACQQSVHLAYMKAHEPERLARAATALHCKDWLYFRLTGKRATDPSEAIYTYGDFRTRAYAWPLLEPLGIADQADKLPTIIDGTRVSHPLTGAAARATGLPQGLPVVLGYLDVLCTALGAGVYDAHGGRGCSILGSTGMHMTLAYSAETVRLNPGRSGYTMLFPAPGVYAQMQSNMAATLNIDWLARLAGDVLALAGSTARGVDLLATVENAVLEAPAATTMFHPYITTAGERGPFLDPHARGNLCGLAPDTGFAGLLRGVYEGLAMAARDCYGAMGPIPDDIRVAGGAARSPAMRSIMASVLGRPVRSVARQETGAAGAAMIAAVQRGVYSDMAACVEDWVTPLIGPASLPDPHLTSLYDPFFELYRDIRIAMPPAWRRMADIRADAGA